MMPQWRIAFGDDMILSWFDASEAKKFGESLARFFLENIPPASRIGDKAFAQKAEKNLKIMADQIAHFKKQHKLNTYKKAQLGNAFKWVLLDAGTAADYTDELTKWLVQRLG
jgi:hypothetical protein